jgi:predicted acyltransferase
VILIAFYWICKQVNRIFLKQDEPVSNDEAIVVENEVKIKKRLQAIDIFRGVAIVMMIFVNSGGGHYWWIEHATWNGLHVADVVFPFFLFIMGTCIPMSIRSQMNQQKTKSQIVFRIAKVGLLNESK